MRWSDAIDKTPRDKILNPLAVFCFELKLSGANDEGFCVLYFIRCDLGGYPLCLAHVLFFRARSFSYGSFARVSVCDVGV
ncbi:hypothetical protein [uncultured Campylobacter sp.]|uniref:hypothetical protein n=1 Tax=uncultured Campylobacter sp. TaxID=218934 RepID=UPI00260C9060|nr:hypothetical protein [uncultured Campylobacter sp.]